MIVAVSSAIVATILGTLASIGVSWYKLFGKSYKSLMEIAKERKPDVEKLHKEMTNINEQLLSSYINEHKIKGAEGFVPVFRISPSLLKLHNYDVEIIKNTPRFSELYNIYTGLL
mgnify:CR=1 FL=1